MLGFGKPSVRLQGEGQYDVEHRLVTSVAELLAHSNSAIDVGEGGRFASGVDHKVAQQTRYDAGVVRFVDALERIFK